MAAKHPSGLRDKAIHLRGGGWTYREIAGSLGISISTCSLWLRDIPAPPRPGHDQERVAAMWRKRWEPHHRERERERQRIKRAATREIGDLTDREVLMGGALVYWCEGAKDKTYRRQERVTFINSDPAVITFFLRFLRVAGVSPGRLRFRLHIHETADVQLAGRYWSRLTGAPVEDFQKPVIKRHKPQTVRKNLAEGYHGCLVVDVAQSADLYRRIEGWAYAAMLGGEAARIRFRQRPELAIDRLDTDRNTWANALPDCSGGRIRTPT